MAATTPKYLLPEMEGTPVSEPAFYRSLFIVDTLKKGTPAANDGKPPAEAAGAEPVDPFDETKIGSETQRELAVGILAVHKQGWVQSGLALGNLLQSVCLAPGEVTRIAVTDWRRKTSAKSTEETQQSESVSSQIDQSRAVNEVQRAVASEAQSGSSSTVAGAASTQGGFAMSSLFASGSVSAAASTSTALTAQFSAGNRNVAASSTNAMAQKTAEKSQALRSRRQSVVREVSEQESEQLSSRVLANYNRRHSLNVEYFEVLQMYKIKTELAAWERCLFVPFKPIDFSDAKTLQAHKAQLFEIFRSWGAVDLATRLASAESDQKTIETMKMAIDQKITEVVTAFNTWARYRPLWDSRVAGGTMPGQDDLIKRWEAEYTAIQKKYPDILTPIEGLAALPPGTNWVSPLIEKLSLERAQLHLPLSDILNTHRIFLSQQIWVRMDPYRIYRALQRYQFDGKPLSSLVEPRPVGVFGNYVAFRRGFAEAQENESKEFEDKYLKKDRSVAEGSGFPLLVSLQRPYSGAAKLPKKSTSFALEDGRTINPRFCRPVSQTLLQETAQRAPILEGRISHRLSPSSAPKDSPTSRISIGFSARSAGVTCSVTWAASRKQ